MDGKRREYVEIWIYRKLNFHSCGRLYCLDSVMGKTRTEKGPQQSEDLIVYANVGEQKLSKVSINLRNLRKKKKKSRLKLPDEKGDLVKKYLGPLLPSERAEGESEVAYLCIHQGTLSIKHTEPYTYESCFLMYSS